MHAHGRWGIADGNAPLTRCSLSKPSRSSRRPCPHAPERRAGLRRVRKAPSRPPVAGRREARAQLRDQRGGGRGAVDARRSRSVRERPHRARPAAFGRQGTGPRGREHVRVRLPGRGLAGVRSVRVRRSALHRIRVRRGPSAHPPRSARRYATSITTSARTGFAGRSTTSSTAPPNEPGFAIPSSRSGKPLVSGPSAGTAATGRA